jgi:uncharacterized protein YxjI
MAPLPSNGDAVDRMGGQIEDPQQPQDNQLSRNTRYRMSADLVALGHDFPVLTDAGEHVFRFSGRAITNHDTVQIEDMRGRLLYSSQLHEARKANRIVIVDSAETETGTVVRKPSSPLRDRFILEVSNGPGLTIDGSISTYEFRIVGPSGAVAEISKRWFRARGSYGVEVTKSQDDALLLTAVVVLDQMIRGVT